MSFHPAAIAKFNEGCRAAEMGLLAEAAQAFEDSLTFDVNFEQALVNLCSLLAGAEHAEGLSQRLARIAALKRGEKPGGLNGDGSGLLLTQLVEINKNLEKLIHGMAEASNATRESFPWIFSTYQMLTQMRHAKCHHDWKREVEADRQRCDPRVLYLYGSKIYSQNDEDGILKEIFRRIGVTNRYLVEFGVSCTEANSINLLQLGWSALWMDANDREIENIILHHKDKIESGALKILKTYITAENIEELLSSQGVPTEMDYFSIDIDGNDYYIWKALKKYHPRVVSIEYNGQFDPESDFVQNYDPTWPGFPGHSYYGCGLRKLSELAESKGYSLVGCNFHGVNAFFVRHDLIDDKFYAPGDVNAHFRPLVWRFYELTPGGHALRFYR